MGLGIVIAVDGIPDEELAQADAVEVHERAGETTTYSLRFPLDVTEGDLPLLTDRRLGPGSDVSVLVPVGGVDECLVKGPVHAQEIRLEHGGPGSRLEVRGSDSTIAMDREVRSAVWEGADSDAVSTIVSGYGYLPDVDRTNGLHPEAKHTLVQRDSDLRFVRRLARRNGFDFWVTATPFGVETAHFRRPRLAGASDGAIVINLEEANVKALDLSWDVERPTSAEGAQLDLNAKSIVDGSAPEAPLAVLGERGLAEIAGAPASVHVSPPADDAGDLRARAEGALVEAGWFVRATCTTSLETAGSLVRPHSLADVRGAGPRHSGAYFVGAVRHVIDPTGHRMDVELRRNGWGG